MSEQVVKILVVEDNPVDALWVKHELFEVSSKDFAFSLAETVADAAERLADEAFDVILLDLGLPDSQGLDTFERIRRLARDVPIVVASGTDDETLAIEAVRGGAQDYLIKEKWDGLVLWRTIAYAMERQRLLIELQRSQSSLRRTARALKVRSECSLALTRATGETALLSEVCRLIVEVGEYPMAWVGIPLEDESASVKPVAIAGNENGYLDNVSITWSENETGRGPTGTAIRTASCQINRNSLLDRDFHPWRAEALNRGYLSSIALPIMIDDAVFGALTIYAGEVDAFDSEEVRLLGELGRDLGFGITSIRTRAGRERALVELQESEQRLETVFDTAEDYLFIKDRDLRYVKVNSATAKLGGLSPSDFAGRKIQDIFGAEARKSVEDVELRALDGQTIEGEQAFQVRGVPVVFSYSITPLRDASGHVTGIFGIARDVTDRRRTDQPSGECADDYPSKSMRSVLAMAQAIAPQHPVILLLGESGSGKDYLAKYIHDHSLRSNSPYFSLNCAAIASHLAESELFGHEKGAFTGAVGRKRGVLELAEGGTLLLNEVGELSLALQAKLLTFLDTRKFTRVGGTKEVLVNARIMAATNRDLGKAVAEGGFRQDLFYRINVVKIRVPPLRERREDIPVLANEILSRLVTDLQFTTVPKLNKSTLVGLGNYHWPGNVRELRNVLERALILSEGKRFEVLLPASPANGTQSEMDVRANLCGKTLREVTDEITRMMCLDALEQCNGNKKEAARLLGIARDSLYRYLRQFGMSAGDDAEKTEHTGPAFS